MRLKVVNMSDCIKWINDDLEIVLRLAAVNKLTLNVCRLQVWFVCNQHVTTGHPTLY